MSTKHTPGLWSLVERQALEDGSVYPAHIIGGKTGMQVCLMESSNVAKAIVHDPSWSHLGNSVMAKANARLIAAAPELLEVSQLLAAFNFNSDVLLGEIQEKARAAIFKATGEAAPLPSRIRRNGRHGSLRMRSARVRTGQGH